MNDNLKKTLTNYFLTDSRYFLNIYNILSDNNQPEQSDEHSRRSKVFINLLLSMDCSLKALIFLMSADSEDEKTVYNNIKECGHKLENLLSKCDLTDLKEVTDLIQQKGIDKIPYDVLYTLEAEAQLREDTIMPTDDYYDMISNFIFLKEAESCANKLLAHVNEKYNAKFSTLEVHYFEDLNFKELTDNNSRIKHISDRP